MQSPQDSPVSSTRLPDATVTERQQGAAIVVAAAGAIDMLTAPQLAEQIEISLAKKPQALVVDLSDVDFLATAGMEVLITAHRAAGAAVRFAVVADGPATSRPMKITGITELIDLYASLDEALERLAA